MAAIEVENLPAVAAVEVACDPLVILRIILSTNILAYENVIGTVFVSWAVNGRVACQGLYM